MPPEQQTPTKTSPPPPPDRGERSDLARKVDAAKLKAELAKKLLDAKPGEYACIECGYKTKHQVKREVLHSMPDGSKVKGPPIIYHGDDIDDEHAVNHACDPVDRLKFQKRLRPAELDATNAEDADTAHRSVLGIRRSADGEQFDVVHFAGNGRRTVLMKDEALDVAMQKITDEAPDRL